MKYNYNTKEDFDYYYDGNRLDIINEIPKNKTTYLDVGCGRGGVLKLIKEKCSNKAELWGIEPTNKAYE